MRRVAVSLALVVAAASIPAYGQEQATLYLFAVDQKGVPLLDLKASDVSVKEDVGASTIRTVRRFGWPMKVTVLVDNGLRTADALVHYRTGLRKFFTGLPPGVPVSLIATAPQPRWLFRETTDRVQIEKGIGLITTDESLGRFSDALIEYAARLDTEFRNVSTEQMPPYLPVLVSIATTDQDGSDVRRESNLKMILSLRKHLAWTNLIMIAPPLPGAGVLTTDADVGQNAEIAKIVQEATRGTYMPVTGSGTSALSSTLLPELAQAIARRHIRQMTQHRIVLERPAGARGPMKNFALALSNHPGAKIIVSIDGNLP
jgi:hypothetical protein